MHHRLCLVPECFHPPPKETLYAGASPHPSLLSPICLLSLWICLFWTFRANEVKQHVPFGGHCPFLNGFFGRLILQVMLYPGGWGEVRSCSPPCVPGSSPSVAFLSRFGAAPIRVPGNKPLSRLLAPLSITQGSTCLAFSLPQGPDPRGDV